MNPEKQALIENLRRARKALTTFLLLEKQAAEWEQDLENMRSCLPDLYCRRHEALERYLEVNGLSDPIIDHHKITPEKIEFVEDMLRWGLSETVEEALGLD